MSLPLFLQDKRFLYELDHLKIKLQFIKITILNWQELPVAEVQGICISGNLNIDGNSSMRRTASLSILASEKLNNLDNLDNLFAINKKCKLELGIKNTVSNYSFISNNNTTVINYKNLYGDIVWFPLGFFVMFNPSISYGLDGATISMNLKDKMCLLNGDIGGVIPASVNFSNQDELVDINGISLLKNPVLIYNIIKLLVNHLGNLLLLNIIISEVPLQIKKAVQWNGEDNIYLKKESNQGYNYILTYQLPTDHSTLYYKFYRNDVIGYVYTDFIWPRSSDLECNAGDTITSVLDKIIGILGNYEYFYDILGRFIFQLKRNFLNMSYTAYWNKDKDSQRQAQQALVYADMPLEVYDPHLYTLSSSTYNFDYNLLVTNFNNNLNYNNIKNDFVVWGSNTTTKRICRYHLAIDTKPKIGQTHNIILLKDKWGIWRGKGTTLTPSQQHPLVISRTSIDWREEIYYQMLESEISGLDENTERNNTYSQYYAELKEEFPKEFNLQTQTWNANIVLTPELIEYYLDFIDDGSKLSQYSVNNIGRRAKVIDGSNEKINCVFEPVIPDVVYVNSTMFLNVLSYNEFIQRLTNYGQSWTNITSSMYNSLTTAIVPNSCFEKIKDLLYQHTNMADTVSVSTLPIYYLEPNTIISLSCALAGIEGDYIIQSMSVPLDINSTMNMNVYKALDKI